MKEDLVLNNEKYFLLIGYNDKRRLIVAQSKYFLSGWKTITHYYNNSLSSLQLFHSIRSQKSN